MMKKFLVILITIIQFFTISANAKVRVITTTSNLADIVRQVGGDLVEVESLCRGTQDPHYLEAKPSYTFKLSKAQLLVSIGAGLEVGWLPLVVRGSRNPNLRVGESGRLEVAQYVNLLEKGSSHLSRADGDVHPEGNPHFMLGPIRSVMVAKAVQKKMQAIDPGNKKIYAQNAIEYEKKIESALIEWKKKIEKGTKIISYHKTLTYFYDDFGIENVDVLEPKPGIPPSASHIVKIISEIKEMNIQKILIENYFDDAIAKRIQKDVPGISILVVPVAVNGQNGIYSLFDLYDYLVTKIGK